MGTKRLTDIAADIKATGDDIATDAERVQQIEIAKVSLRADDPRLIELANESEAITAEMAVKAKVETALVEEAAATPGRTARERRQAGNPGTN